MARRRLEHMDEVELKRTMNNVLGAMARELPPRTLFVALAFDEAGLAQYGSNCDRRTMVQALRETADRLERRDTVERTPLER